jgi:hypothetical protein
MERRTVKDYIDFRYMSTQPRWKDLKHSEYQDDDLIHIGYDDDDGWFILIERERLENDEEYNNRMEDNWRYLEYSKKRRYENYLKLKEEFENENISYDKEN